LIPGTKKEELAAQVLDAGCLSISHSKHWNWIEVRVDTAVVGSALQQVLQNRERSFCSQSDAD
jgi:hypothetical protein